MTRVAAAGQFAHLHGRQHIAKIRVEILLFPEKLIHKAEGCQTKEIDAFACGRARVKPCMKVAAGECTMSHNILTGNRKNKTMLSCACQAHRGCGECFLLVMIFSRE